VNNNIKALWKWMTGLTLGRLIKYALWVFGVSALLVFAGFALYVLLPAHSIPEYEPVDEFVYLDQGWGAARDSEPRQTYYYTPQGTSMPQGAVDTALRYDWFIHLEMPFGETRFAAPEHMRAYRFIVDPAASAANPDQLPLGFTRHFDEETGEYVLDITCAACHSGQINYTRDGTRYAIRIDGGQAMHAFTDMSRGNFAPTLIASMLATYFNPIKFNRFANKVLGERYPEGKPALRKEFWATLKAFAGTGQNNPLRHLYPSDSGFGRLDALGRIANTVFGDHLTPANYHEADAPVSFPYVWNIWKFDWVQYNASVKQPLARNVGEAMGVGAVINLLNDDGQPIPPEQRYNSSVRIPDLVKIEQTLQQLQPPEWPESIFGPVEQEKAAHGAELFETHCQSCHGPHVVSEAYQQAQAPGKPDPSLEWMIKVIPVEEIGTDPTAATGFIERHYDLSPAGITNSEVRALLQPLQIRELARDFKYRLTTVIELRQQQALDVGELPAMLAAYPDPNKDRDPVLARTEMAAVAAETLRLTGTQTPKTAPSDNYKCGVDCQTQWLLWDAQGAEQAITHALDALDITRVTEGEGLNIIGLMIKNKFYRDNGISYEDQQCIEGFGTLDLPQQIAGYKPRPLAGVWATPPFLHNGSVPNLYQMLVPPEQRDKRFFVGRLEFDPVNVGYVTTPRDDGKDNGFWLDTTVKGNHNSGHAFTATPE
jgi:cytochrome c5